MIHDVRLFLWKLPNGLQLGFYARARCRLADPHYAAHVDADDEVLEVRDMRDSVLVVGRDGTLTERDGRLAVPVLSGIRKYPEPTCYVVGCSTSYDRFRDLLAGAAVREHVPLPENASGP